MSIPAKCGPGLIVVQHHINPFQIHAAYDDSGDMAHGVQITAENVSQNYPAYAARNATGGNESTWGGSMNFFLFVCTLHCGWPLGRPYVKDYEIAVGLRTAMSPWLFCCLFAATGVNVLMFS